MKDRTIAVTGARGRVGRLLVRELLDAGCRVRQIDALPAVDTTDYWQVDLDQPAETVEALLRPALEGVDGVVHLAALMSWDDRQAAHLHRVNGSGTLALLRALHNRTPHARFVLASSGEVYPELAPEYLPIDEQHPTRPSSHYGLSKLMAEEAAQFYARRGLPTVIVRFAHTQQPAELCDPGSFFSGPRFFVSSRLHRLRETAAAPADSAHFEAIARLEAIDRPGQLQLLLARGPEGTPYRMGIADARDIVQGLLLALTHPSAVGEVFNVGPASAVSFDELIPYMAKRWNLPYVTVDLPLTPYRYETSVEKAKKLLGYRPRYSVFDMVDEAAVHLPIGAPA